MSGGCPVKGDAVPNLENVDNQKEGGCPVKNHTNNASSAGLLHWLWGNSPAPSPSPSTSSIPPPTQVSPAYNPAANDLIFGSERHPSQKANLSVVRTVSTIPKSSSTETPEHQPSGAHNWVYPSEQQYYNAMKRKGYSPNEKDTPVILAIHNVVNEQGWSKICEWEALRGCADPKLKKFMGRPKDLSPKAYFLNLLGYSKPFDRHDWIIDRNGKEVRYVIDFYKGKSPSHFNAPMSVFLDVRPALDSPQAAIDIISRGFREWHSLYFFPDTGRGLGNAIIKKPPSKK